MEILIFHTHQRLSPIISPSKFMQLHFSKGCLFSLEKTVWLIDSNIQGSAIIIKSLCVITYVCHNFDILDVLEQTGFNLTTRDSFYTMLGEVFLNRILAESTYFTNHVEWTEHKIMASKLANTYQIIWQCHSFKSTLIHYFQYHPFLYKASFGSIIFYRAKNNKLKRQDN